MVRETAKQHLFRGVAAAWRRTRRPEVSVVIPCKDAEPYIEAAVRSALNQSVRDIEVIVVDDGSTDGSRDIVSGLASRDRRVVVLDGEQRGPGAARNRGVERARGAFLAFIDADDVMLPGALESMLTAARQSGSDVVKGAYRRHSALGSHRPKLTARVHAEERLGTTPEEFPDLLDEPVLWNGLYRTAFWKARVHPIPEDVNYEDQQPSLAAALQARSVDVLATDVYSWRLPEDRNTRSQSKSSLADLADRRTVLHRMRLMLDEHGASHAVRQHLLAVWLGRDLLMYAEKVPVAVPTFREELRLIGAELTALMDEGTWNTFGFWERMTAWALSHPDPEVLDDVLATRWEEASALPLLLDEDTGELRAAHPLLERWPEVPEHVRALSPLDIRLVCTARKMRFADAHHVEMKAEVHVAGLDPRRSPLDVEIAAVSVDGTAEVHGTVERVKAPWADLVANDPWRSYTSAGIRARVPLADAEAQQFWVRTTVGGRALEAVVPLPVTSLSYRLGPVEGSRQSALTAADDGSALVTAINVSPFVIQRVRTGPEHVELHVLCTDLPVLDGEVRAIARRQGTEIEGAVSRDWTRLEVSFDLPEMKEGATYRGERAFEVQLLVGGRSFPISWDRKVKAARARAVRVIPDRAGNLQVEQRFARVTIDGVSVEGPVARLSGRVDPPGLVPQIWLVSSRARTRLQPVPRRKGRWSANVDLSDPSLASDGYFVRWSLTPEEQPEGWARAGRDLRKGEYYVERTCRSVRLAPQRGGPLGITLGPPLSRTERTRAGRTRLIAKDFGPLTPGVFFESFNGKSSGGNPRALFDALLPGCEGPLWWSVVDGTVPVPPGATPVVAGSESWFRALRTARVLVTNNNFPHWFTKVPGQMIVQTWHGTPIKKLIHDAPPNFTPLVYRRLIERQAAQWDLLLAQDEEAERRLRSALRYDGPVRLGDQPQNVRLEQGAEGRERVREELGIPTGARAVLYAPTWREKMRRASGEDSLKALMDPAGLAAETGAWVLVRSHHMNGLRAEGERVIDVGSYPHVEDLMLASDVLVSDYSSIFYDYRLTGQPMIVHAPDLEWYRDVERGFYGRWPDDLNLPMSRTQEELTGLVNGALTVEHHRPDAVSTAGESISWLRGEVLRAIHGTDGSHPAQQDDNCPPNP